MYSIWTTIGQKLASKIPASNKQFTDYLPITGYSGSFVFEPIHPSEIELEIILTPTNKAHGLYSCPNRLLKCSRHIIAKPLATLFNASVQSGYFLSKLKY